MIYSVRLVATADGLRQLEEPWTQLLLSCRSATVFASYEWNAGWWHHFGAGNKLHILTVWSDQEQLVGIAPLMVRRLGLVRKLEFVGTGLSDYGDVVAHPQFETDVIGALLAYLSTNHHNWDLGDWSEVPPASPLLAGMHRFQTGDLRLAASAQTPCPVINLPDTWEVYVSSLARKRRYYASSYPRKFIREHQANLEVITGGSEVDEAVVTFHRLHMARWQQREGTLSEEHQDAGFLPFLREVCGGLAARGWLRIVSLRAGDETVASTINFMLHGRWSAYMKGFDPRWYDKRPGTVLDALRIGQAIKEGARQFDFGRGEEEYKSGFGVDIYTNTRLLLATSAPRSLAAFVLLRRRIRAAQRQEAARAGSTGGDALPEAYEG